MGVGALFVVQSDFNKLLMLMIYIYQIHVICFLRFYIRIIEVVDIYTIYYDPLTCHEPWHCYAAGDDTDGEINTECTSTGEFDG